MKYRDEYRDPELADRLIRAIRQRSRTSVRLIMWLGRSISADSQASTLAWTWCARGTSRLARAWR